MSRGDGLEGGLEIGEGLDAVDLRGLDQGRAIAFGAKPLQCLKEWSAGRRHPSLHA